MARRFKTDIRLWLLVSAVLFVPPWFFHEWGKHGDIHPAQLWLMLFSEDIVQAVGGILFFTLWFGIPAAVIGWIIQCFIVMIRSTVTKRTDDGVPILRRQRFSTKVQGQDRDRRFTIELAPSEGLRTFSKYVEKVRKWIEAVAAWFTQTDAVAQGKRRTLVVICPLAFCQESST